MLNSICVVGGLGNMGAKHFKKLEPRFQARVGTSFPLDGSSSSAITQTSGLDVSDIGCEKDLSKYDALIIATPSATHYEIAKSAIERGQHVLVEKPVTLSYKEAQTLYRLAKEYNVVYMSGHTMRYNPEFRKALPELYHTHELDFKMFLPHKNKKENATFDLLIHGFELCFNLGQRDFSRDFELLDCYSGEEMIAAKVRIGSKECTFSAMYNCDHDIRKLTGFDAWDSPVVDVDFHASDGQQPDALSNLHDHFIRACDNGTWIDQAEYATAAVQLAEQVQECLFPGVSPVV